MVMLCSKVVGAIALLGYAHGVHREEPVFGGADGPNSLTPNASNELAVPGVSSAYHAGGSATPATWSHPTGDSQALAAKGVAPSQAPSQPPPSAVNASSFNSQVGKRYAGPALDILKNALKTVEAEDHQAQVALDKATAAFTKALEVQAKADSAAKAAADTEAQLTETKAAALRSVQAAKEMNVAATRADMDAEADAGSTNTSSFKRDLHNAQEAVLRAEHNLEAIQVKLAATEKTSAAAQEAASNAGKDTLAAQQVVEQAKEAKAKAGTAREQIEAQVTDKANTIAELAETFASASQAKVDALKEFQVAKEALLEAAHSAAVFKQVQGPPSRPSNATKPSAM